MTETAPAVQEGKAQAERRTIARLWRDAVAASRPRPAYLVEADEGWREVSWEEADVRVKDVANGLLSRCV
jgi:long-subunit acyl-CoA synthetase (AMP-forming)